MTRSRFGYSAVRTAKPIKIAPPLAGSLEYIWLKAGIEKGFLDVRHRGPSAARVLGHTDYQADWTQVFDGLIFTRRMYPSTPIRKRR